jgi:hypothetical protein
LNMGVWSFLSEPAAGLLNTARGGPLSALPQGVAAGTSALVANTVFAFSNAAVKLLTSWRRSIILEVHSSPPRLQKQNWFGFIPDFKFKTCQRCPTRNPEIKPSTLLEVYSSEPGLSRIGLSSEILYCNPLTHLKTHVLCHSSFSHSTCHRGDCGAVRILSTNLTA